MLADTSMEVVLGVHFLLPPPPDADIGLQRACLDKLLNAEAMPFGHYQEG